MLRVALRTLVLLVAWPLASLAAPDQTPPAAADATSPPAADAPPLRLNEVLDSSIRAVPRILEASEQRVAADAQLLSAQGGFDRRLEQDASVWANGFYDGRRLDTRIVQPLQDLGADLYAGYRISDGDFPVYEDELVTLDGGEFNVGISVPLLRDRRFDTRRYRLRQGELGVQIADTELLRVQMEVQHDAMQAYWRWVTAGLRLRVFERLLKIAEQRDVAFRAQLDAGDVAEIEVVENYQNVLKRRALARQSERDLMLASVELSFFLRDAQGAPRRPGAALLPAGFPTISVDPVADVASDLVRALEYQASLLRMDVKMSEVRNDLRLARNVLQPEVDVGVKVARDLGDGSTTRNGTDVIAELKVSMPVQRRAARGDIAAAEAELRSLGFARQQLTDRLRLRIAQLVERVEAATEFTRLARQEAEQAQVLEEAEWTRFREGASSFFLLNVREQNTADARVRALDAARGYFEAVADYYLATAALDALNIVGRPIGRP